MSATFIGCTIRSAGRRAKYLLLETDAGTLILHLGMSGSLRVLPASTPRITHDHVDIELDSGQTLRFNDPRRFGSLLFAATRRAPAAEEPRAGTARRRFRRRLPVEDHAPAQVAIKQLIMNRGWSWASETSTRARRCSARVSPARRRAR
jgi:formamidopyrimidine-DNA glycosylase